MNLTEIQQNTFKITTFNVNSIRARLHILKPWLEANRVDVLCIQETKVQDHEFPVKFFAELGYAIVFRGQKSYNGVAVASLHPIEDVSFGFDDEEHTGDDDVRLLHCTVNGIKLINTYVPQGKSIDDPAYRYKLRWFQRLKALFSEILGQNGLVFWCGDMNVAPEPEDVHSPEKLADHVCFHIDVRNAFKDTVAAGFEDILRKFHPEPGQYTFFDYRMPGSVTKKKGWRIDHVLANKHLARLAIGAEIDLGPRLMEKPSDHTALTAFFKLH